MSYYSSLDWLWFYVYRKTMTETKDELKTKFCDGYFTLRLSVFELDSKKTSKWKTRKSNWKVRGFSVADHCDTSALHKFCDWNLDRPRASFEERMQMESIWSWIQMVCKNEFKKDKNNSKNWNCKASFWSDVYTDKDDKCKVKIQWTFVKS